MTESVDSREQEIARALKQLTADYQQRRLSLPAYRRLRRKLLASVDNGKTNMSLPSDRMTDRPRPGIIVWLAVAAIVLLLVLVGWLLR